MKKLILPTGLCMTAFTALVFVVYQVAAESDAKGGATTGEPSPIAEPRAKMVAGANANATLSLDLIPNGGAGNQRNDGVTSGTVSGRGTKIAIEVFATGVTTSLTGMQLRFDFDASLLTFVKAENRAFSLPLPHPTGTDFAATSPVRLASSGFLTRAEFTTATDVAGRAFSIGIASVTLSESLSSRDTLTTTSRIEFNAMAPMAPTPDFDGDRMVGFSDFLAFAGRYDTRQGEGSYRAKYDLNRDGAIDFSDFLIFAGSYGNTVPPPPPGGSSSPDLIVESPSVSASTLTPGQSFTLRATVRNRGTGQSAETTLRYYRSSDATISTSDTEVDTDLVRGLSASGTDSESISLTAPSGSGTYYYGACVASVSDESNTDNNCSAGVRVTVSSGGGGGGGTPKMYWTVSPFRGTNKIQRANLDGSNVEDLITTGLDWPNDIALDVGRGKMYWTDRRTDKIQRANLDGSQVEDLITTGLIGPVGIALDVGRGKMYWTGIRKIQRANLDGSQVEDFITGLRGPVGIALDVGRGKMYWTDWRTDKIHRANLDGSQVEDFITGLRGPEGIALDVGRGKMYWTDPWADKIQRANLDGSQVEDLITRLSSPHGIALDVGRGKMYWTDDATDKIHRANLDGSQVEDLITTGLDRPHGIALDTQGTGSAGGGGSSRSDLIVESPSVSDSVLTSGQSFTLRATVRNRGTWQSAATTLRYYQSSDSTISTRDIRVGTDSVSGLSASGTSAESISLTTPSLRAGTYYYGACVASVTGESNTNNNCSAGVRVTVEGPDLIVESPSVSDNTLTPGQSFTLRATVRNRGTWQSAATTLRYYQSSNANFTTIDTEVGTDSVSELSASGTSAESISLTTPSLRAGTYYYGACVASVTGEINTNNNCSAGVRVTIEGPDLIVESSSVSESTLTPGQSFTLRATVRNRGSWQSAATTLRYYQSSNAKISTRDIELGTDSVSGLSASGTSAESISLTAPLRAGTHYYGACVARVTGESNTNNNCSAGVRVTVERPDLIVESPSVSDNTLTPGQSFTLRATVRNRGSDRSASTTLRYYQSFNAKISTSDTEVGTASVSGLSASGTGSESISLTAPLRAGTYYYGACVASVSDESNTNNNCSAGVRVTVSSGGGGSSGPDLIVESSSVSDNTLMPEQSFTLRATVRNRGTDRSASTTLRYYQSSDATITTNDTEVGIDSVSGLSASGTGSESIRLTIPSSRAGTYYYGACVASVSGESNTDNNCSDAVRVTVGLFIAPGEIRQYTRTFSASFSYTRLLHAIWHRVVSSDIDSGLLGVANVNVDILSREKYPPFGVVRSVTAVRFTYNLSVSSSIPLNTTLRARVTYQILKGRFSNSVKGTYTVPLTIFVSENSSGSAKLTVGDAESAMPVQEQGSLPPSSTWINLKRYSEEPRNSSP